ncbi:hypothetical protein QJS04_geneDACA003638 [Acorus gramineus]|uniref:Uncharacterized protein n=1 Tax=Acorus gramineus TaxID=55184 RepID=A0AAV9BR09_ACOGR|nr:hypothetical protein QJS04_geneDACA003638 [Acorus gramineus]
MIDGVWQLRFGICGSLVLEIPVDLDFKDGSGVIKPQVHTFVGCIQPRHGESMWTSGENSGL